MFPFWLIMLALSRHSPHNSTLPWPWDSGNILASPPLPIKLFSSSMWHKREKNGKHMSEFSMWNRYPLRECFALCGWSMQIVSNPGTQQRERTREVRRDISKGDRITTLLSKPKQPTGTTSEKTFIQDKRNTKSCTPGMAGSWRFRVGW